MAGLWEDEGKQREWRIWDELDWRGRARSSQVGLYSVDILEPQRWTACLCAPSSVLGAQHTSLDKKDKERCKFHSYLFCLPHTALPAAPCPLSGLCGAAS